MAAGRLVEALADVVEPDQEEVHAVFLGRSRLPQRVRVFLQFGVPRLQRFIENGSTLSGTGPST
jgi:DNA-binding transcriptional LysR family regulator